MEVMVGIGINIRILRDKFGLTQAELGDRLGVSRESIMKWETDRVSNIREEYIRGMCELFGVDPDDIKSEQYGIAAQLANAVNPESKQIIPNGSKKAYIPLLGKVHAGNAQEPEGMEGLISVPYEVKQKHPNGYMLKVEGDCMNKVYPEGCLIYIDPDKEPKNGSIAVVSINCSEYVMRRRYRGASSIVLSPDSFNKNHKDIIVLEGDETVVELAGTVVWFQPEKELE